MCRQEPLTMDSIDSLNTQQPAESASFLHPAPKRFFSFFNKNDFCDLYRQDGFRGYVSTILQLALLLLSDILSLPHLRGSSPLQLQPPR